MNTYSKTEIVAKLIENNLNQPKAKYSNNTILNMLNAVDDDTMFTLEPTRNGFAFNRGSLVEEIVKYILGIDTDKSQRGSADIDLKGIDNKSFGLPSAAKKVEVKFATTFAPASASMPTTKYVILINNEGAFLIESANHKGRYTSYSWYEGTRLDIISKILGF